MYIGVIYKRGLFLKTLMGNIIFIYNNHFLNGNLF